MKVSNKGLIEIAQHEGIVPAPYRDSVGVWTVGVGHTAAAGDPDPARMPKGMPDDLNAGIDQALALFRKDVRIYEDRVNAAIKVPIKQYQFDALVSFDFNTGGIHRALLTRKINASASSASEHFFGWLKPPEIRKRRAAEKRLFDTGDYDANGDAVPIWRTNGAGKLAGILKTVSGADILARMSAPDSTAPSQQPSAPDLTSWPHDALIAELERRLSAA